MATVASDSADSSLWKRFAFTIVVLLVFRLGVHIPTPGVNTKALVSIVEQHGGAGVLKLLNMFSGGALANFSVFALGVMPYISASIIIQLMTVVVPTLEQLQKEGGVGRQKITRITRGLAVVLALIQGFMLASGLQAASPDTAAGSVILEPGLSFKLFSALIQTAGTCFVMWMGEQITDKGMGNGVSLLIFAGIVAAFPQGVGTAINLIKDGTLSVPMALGLVVLIVSMVFGISLVEQSYRKIPIHYAKRSVLRGNAVGVHASHLPLKVNMAGVIPAIFASTVLGIPVSIFGFAGKSQNILYQELLPNRWLYNILFLGLVVFFCYVYTSITFKPDDIAENLKKQNAYIPGVRPGMETSGALSDLVSRLTLAGAVYMNLVIVLPMAIGVLFAPSLAFGGTSLLIVVGVALETMRQVVAHRSTMRYDDVVFLQKPPGQSPPPSQGL